MHTILQRAWWRYIDTSAVVYSTYWPIINHKIEDSRLPKLAREKETYSTAAVDNASLLCTVQSHLVISFSCSNVLLVPEIRWTVTEFRANEVKISFSMQATHSVVWWICLSLFCQSIFCAYNREIMILVLELKQIMLQNLKVLNPKS